MVAATTTVSDSSSSSSSSPSPTALPDVLESHGPLTNPWQQPHRQRRPLTPLQRTMRRTRRRRRWTSIRFVCTLLSVVVLLISFPIYYIHTNTETVERQRTTRSLLWWQRRQEPWQRDTAHVVSDTIESSSAAVGTGASTHVVAFSSWEEDDRVVDDDDATNVDVETIVVDDDDIDDVTLSVQYPSGQTGPGTATWVSRTASYYYPWNIFGTGRREQQREQQQHAAQEDNQDQQPQQPQHRDDTSRGSIGNHGDDSNENDDDNGQGSNKHHESPMTDDNDSDDESLSSSSSSSSHHHSKTSKKQSNQNTNPSVYGWTPTQYPNPLLDPMHCAVAYILPHLAASAAAAAASAAAASAATADITTLSNTSRSDDGDTTTTTASATTQTQTAVSQLRLCDPDWLLGGFLLEEVASSMYNFSQRFSRHVYGGNDDNGNNENGSNDNDWNVEVGRPSVRRQRLARHLSDANLITDEPMKHITQSSVKTIGTFSLPAPGIDNKRRSLRSVDPPKLTVPTIELAVATVRKMNLAAVLRQTTYYSYEDEDDMVNDAAQIFARDLHDAWWNNTNEKSADGDVSSSRNQDADHGILLFLSVQDRVCFISTGSAVSSILPWWRLDHIVSSMKPDLRHRDYGNALLRAIEALSYMLEAGPPTLTDRLHDFVSRFGLVIGFAVFTFFFGAWGEYRDRRKRWHYAEQRSKLSGVEKQKAQQLQREFRTRCCPICLENYNYGDSNNWDTTTDRLSPIDEGDESEDEEGKTRDALENSSGNAASPCTPVVRKSLVDEFGIPRRGADGKKIKLLRCGHIFCETCWKNWVHSSACGSPCNCPVCRQDVGKSLCRQRRSTAQSSSASLDVGEQSTSNRQASSSNNNIPTTDGPTRSSYGSFSENAVRRLEPAGSSSGSSNRIIRVSTILRGGVLFRQPLINRVSDMAGQQPTSTIATSQESEPLLRQSPSCHASTSD